jgi:hypothetical protein
MQWHGDVATNSRWAPPPRACPFGTKKVRAEKAAWTPPRLRNLDVETEDQQ